MSKKVLIIEDTADVRESLKLLIQMQGFEAVVARDGFEGCRMAAEVRPDLILMDLALPGMDGIDATKEFRSRPETVGTPILGVSSYSDRFGAEALEAGCNEVFSKRAFFNSYIPTLKKYSDIDFLPGRALIVSS
jgi:CheY-like chemotaxis protein